jgi:D-aspartate ligase
MTEITFNFDPVRWPAAAVGEAHAPQAAALPIFDGEAPGVIVMGGDCGALGVARSLGRLGIPVRFLPGPNRLARYSRYVETVADWPGAESPQALEWLASHACMGGAGGWVLIPAGDSEIRLVTGNHARLAPLFRLTTPPWQVTRFAGDKALTYARAAELGIGHPLTYRIASLAEAEKADLTYPVILKPAMKEGVNDLTTEKAWRANDRFEFIEMFAAGLPLAGEGGLVVQELIPDDGTNQFSYAAFCDAGDPLVVMAARRTRQKPRKAGTGTFVETLGPCAFEADAEAFLRSLGYTGLVEIEFMRDPRDGSYRLIDVNPRIWTWHALGLPAGVNFAKAVWEHANGRPVTRGRAAAGHSWIYGPRDLFSAMEDMRDGRLTLPQYLNQLTGASCFATWAGDDPLPWLADVPLSLRRLLRR